MFIRAAAEGDLDVGKTAALVLNGWPVVLIRTASDYFALLNRCSHAAMPIDKGRVRGSAIMCPHHGARFNIETGACLGSYLPLRRFAVRVEGGQIEVDIPGHAPTINDMPAQG